MEKPQELNSSVMDNIVPFSGTLGEMSPADRIMAEGGAMQKVETPYTTAMAVQKPRSISRVVANVLKEAELAGSAFYYRWEVYDKEKKRKVPIQGPSIDLAMCVARNYGNCAIDVHVNETLTHYIFKGVFVDLETGFTVPRLFRQRKSQNIGGKMSKDRAEDLVFQIGQSKAQRNAIVKAAPGWLIDQAIETAKKAEIDKINPENMAVTRANVLDYFAKYGVTQEQLEKYRERKADNWVAEDIVDLKAIATGLKEGRVSVEEVFPPEAEEPTPQQGHDEPGQDETGTEGDSNTETGTEGDSNTETGTGENSENAGQEFEGLTSMKLSKFINLRSSGLKDFVALFNPVFSIWPGHIKRIVVNKLEREEKWAPLLDEIQGVEKTEAGAIPEERNQTKGYTDAIKGEEKLSHGFLQCPDGKKVAFFQCEECRDGPTCKKKSDYIESQKM